MLNRMELERVIDLHQRAWEFLKQTKGIFGEVRSWRNKSHDDRYDEVALEVLRGFAANHGIRVSKEDINDFAHLYDSFFSTSQNPFGYTNLMIAYHVSARRKAAFKDDALFLKRIVVREYADQQELPFTDTEVYDICKKKDLTRHVALVTYSHQLLRRTEFPGQGNGVLLLWREFSWEEGHLQKGFRLTADMVLEAEAKLIEAMKEYAEVC